MTDLGLVRAGQVPYRVAWDWQRELHERRVVAEIPDVCLLVEHEGVFTAGKRTSRFERPTDGTPVVDVDRGGKITWHGPGQLTGYPILRLPMPLDVVAHVRRLEDTLMRVCARFGVATVRVAGRSGVWVPADGARPERKVAAIGVRVARGVTMHGFALNADCDLGWFGRIVPCGITDAGVTSLTAELGDRVTVDDVLPLVEAELAATLGAVPLPLSPTDLDLELTGVATARLA